MKKGNFGKERLITFFSRNGKRIVAALMVAVMVVTWCMTDFVVVAEEIERVITEWTDEAVHDNPFDYAMFAGDENNILCINANSVKVNGDVHTNKGFLYHGNTIEVSGILESKENVQISVSDADYLNKIGKIKENVEVIDCDNIFNEIVEEIGEDATVCNGYANYSGIGIYDDTIVYGDAGIFSSKFYGDCVFVATGNIQFGVENLSSVNGGRIFMGSQSGNITINASDTQLDGIIYAPNGTVMITGSNVQINGRIIAKQILFYGSNLTINASPEDLTILDCLQNEISVEINCVETVKENEKVVPVLTGTGSNKWDKDAIVWSVNTIKGENSEESVEGEDYVLLAEDDKLNPELVFLEAGTYEIKADVTYKEKLYTASKLISVTEDLAPEAVLDTEAFYLRNAEGEAEIILKDASYSLDGNEIISRRYVIYYDANNDGLYDVTEEVETINENVAEVTYQTGDVGNYKAFLWVCEDYDEEIYEAVGETILRSASATVTFEVGNVAPEIQENISRVTEADILYLYGEKASEQAMAELARTEEKLAAEGVVYTREDICINDSPAEELKELAKLMESRQLVDGNIYVIYEEEVWSDYTDAERAAFEEIIAESGARYIQFNEETESSTYVNWICDGESKVSNEVGTNLLAGSRVEYAGVYRDYENDPKFSIEYTYSITNGSDVENSVVSAPINILTKPGVYDISVKVQDNPVGDNEAYDEYRLWSEEYSICQDLVVCERPVCSFDVELTEDEENTGLWKITVKDTSGNAAAGEGSDISHSYKKAGEEQWNEDSLPTELNAGEVYLIKGVITDAYGNESLPAVEVICVPETAEPEIEITASLSVQPKIEILLVTEDNNALNEEYKSILEEYDVAYEEAGWEYNYNSTYFWEGEFGVYEGHYYYIPAVKPDWLGAKELCEQMGGHLVTVSSKEESNYIRDYAVAVDRDGYVAIGFHDSNVEGQWEWVTGEPVVYKRWRRGEPNDGRRNQDHAFMYTNGYWDDGYNDRTSDYFLCEWDSQEDFFAGRSNILDDIKSHQGGIKLIITDLYETDFSEENKGFWEENMYETGADVCMVSDADMLRQVLDAYMPKTSEATHICYVGDEVTCEGNYTGLDTEEGYSWQFVTDYEAFDGSDASHTVATELPVLDKAGIYTITLAVYRTINGEITEEITVPVAELTVHDRPVADIEGSAWRDHENPDVAYTEVTYEAASPSWGHAQNQGIDGYDFAYKKVGETEWNIGRLPETVDLDAIYLVRLTVTDVKGIYSYPAVGCISSKGLELPDITKPEIEITLSKNPAVVGDEISIGFEVSDDKGLSEYALYIDGEVVGCENGTYSFVPEETGDYVISGYAKDAAGNENTVNHILSVKEEIFKDTKAPIVEITQVKNNEANPEIVEFYGTVKDETALYEYRLSGYCMEDANTQILVASGSDNLENVFLGSIDLSTIPEGSYEFILYAKDMAGNESSDSVSFVNAVLSLEFESLTQDSENDCILFTGHISEGGGNVTVAYTCVENNTGMVVAVENVSNDGTLCKIKTSDLITGKYTLTGVVTDQYGNTISAYAVFDYTEGISTEAETEVEETTPAFVWEGAAFNEDHSAIIIKGTKGSETTPTFTCVNVETGEEYALEASEDGNVSTLTLFTQNLVTGSYRVSAFDPVSGEVVASVTLNYNKTITEEETEEEVLTESAAITISVAGVSLDETNENLLVSGSVGGGLAPVTVSVECTNVDTGAVVNGEVAEDMTQGLLAKVPVAHMTDGNYELKITVTDAEGNTCVAGGSFRYTAAKEGSGTASMGQSGSGETFPYDETDVIPPTGSFYLDTTETYLKDATNVVATISDDKAIYKYTLEYRLKGSDEYILLAEGNEAVNNEVIAVFDPTLLKDGVYEVRLNIYDFGGFCASAVSEYTVAGGLKVGNMFIGFTDVSAKIYDMSLNVNRYYSSIDKAAGDFGVGWNLELQGMYLQPSNDLTTGYETKVTGEELSTTFSIAETVSHDVILYFGDGSSEVFTLSLSPASQHLKPIDHVTVGFRCIDNPNVKLEIVGNAGAQYIDSYLWWDDESNYSGLQYKYTDANEVSYYFNSAGTLTAIENEYGDRVKVTDQGYEFDDGSSIIITRDELGRVTSITNREGKACTYEYDANNNLIRYTDTTGNVVSYTYDMNHNLLAILDENGKAVARSEYDAQGRLVATIDADGNRIEYDYDPNARMQSVRDRLGNVTVYYYDDQGNVTKEVDPYGNITLREFDAKGNITRLVDKCNNEMKYTYDSQGNMTGVEFPNGLIIGNTYDTSNRPTGISLGDYIDMSIAYDNKGNVTGTVDGNGNTVTYSYDSNGMLSSISDDIGTIQNTVYREDGQPLSVRNASGTTFLYNYDAEGLCTSIQVQSPDGALLYTYTYTYDERHYLSSMTDTLGNVQTFETDASGNILAKTDALGNRTEYTYDIQSNLVKVLYADGTGESFTYDAEGNVITSVNRLGQTVTMEYDKLNRLKKITYPDGTKESYTYDAVGNVLTHTSVTGAVTTYTYDCTYQVTSVTDAAGGVISYTYDDLGRVETVTDCLGNITSYEYDKNNNVTAMVYPDKTRVTMEYDARNRLVAQTDAYGSKTTYTYDNSDYLVAVTTPLGAKTVYEYDCFGNLTLVKDARGNSTTYTYDALSRVISVTNPLGNTCTYEYDAKGNVISATDFGGNTSTHVYDSMGRLIQTGLGEETVRYTYRNGLLSAVTDASGVVKYEYDTYGRLISETDTFGNEIKYTYDAYGRIETLTSGEVSISYTYDILDRIITVTDAHGNVTTYTYDACGRIISIRHANGMETAYTYSVCGQVEKETVTDVKGKIVMEYSYTHGLNGETLTVEETEGDSVTEVAYTYDKEMRLTGETRSQGENSLSITYTYDAVGNRISKTTTVTGDISGMVNETIEEGTITYTYNAWNQLVSEKQSGTDADYSYDESGAILSLSGDKNITYTYDAKGRLVKYVTRENGTPVITEYTYDYQGTRTSKTVDGKETQYITYSMNGLSYVLYEADASGNVTTEYVRGYQLHTMTKDSETYVYLSDAHMDVRALADSEGNLVNRYRYDAWGNTLYAEEEVENPYRYCQEEYDAESGNTYLRARYYNATSANFLSADAYAGSIDNPMTLNKYAYAGANPVMYADPSGYMFTMAECLTSINMQTMLRSSFAGAVIGGISNGLYCAGDTMSAGGDWDQIIRSFFEGFGTGSVTGMFMGALGSVFMAWKYFKIATGALAIFGFYRGVDSAGEALEEGNEYQALYRLGTSVFSITNWYRMFGKDTARAIEQALRQAQQKASVVAAGVVTAISARSGQSGSGIKTLFHYTNEKGMNGILQSNQLNPSLRANNPNDARYGDGQYLSDIKPNTQTPVGLAKIFINVPNKYKYTHYVEIDVTDLNVVQGREGVFIIPNSSPLNLSNRIVSTGPVVIE
ncbi:MAG: hypothetical protein E7284_02040 [Lachnospiraceae bacterium]|nr:hypothetical protein [Lachnospiraceae bacterium]